MRKSLLVIAVALCAVLGLAVPASASGPKITGEGSCVKTGTVALTVVNDGPDGTVNGRWGLADLTPKLAPGTRLTAKQKVEWTVTGLAPGTYKVGVQIDYSPAFGPRATEFTVTIVCTGTSSSSSSSSSSTATTVRATTTTVAATTSTSSPATSGVPTTARTTVPTTVGTTTSTTVQETTTTGATSTVPGTSTTATTTAEGITETAESTTTGAPTTVALPPGGLARTGSGILRAVGWAMLAVAVGVLLVWAARRPKPRLS